MFNKILIANRGEIACRIIKTCKKLGMETVAICSSADRNSLHVLQADYACCVGEAPSKASYLNIQAIIDAAKMSGVQAIHPGYGFLSESPLLAKACEEAGIVFVGPPPQAMEAMASKQLAKQLLEKTKVPLIPGYHGANQEDAQLLKEAQQIGFPILLKAAQGGGGKGMRSVHHEKDFFNALTSARREAQASFTDDTMLIEKLLINPRHIEVQIMADNHGNTLHLFERDCSVQRRHQKVIEEAPAFNLSPTLRKKLLEAATSVARSIDYRGAGTIEFLVHGDQFYFMEMNTRLQVEHPVTEMITGLDLVEWQFRIAADEPLPYAQSDIKAQGHAIECRIYAEDPNHDFIPSVGPIDVLKEPEGSGIRVDSGVTQNSQITPHYDAMIAKLIAWGGDRAESLRRLQQALKHYVIGGVKTNIPFLQAICSNQNFSQGEFGIDFLQLEQLELKNQPEQTALFMAASYDYLKLVSKCPDAIYQQCFGWQMHLSSHWEWRYLVEEAEEKTLKVSPLTPNSFKLTLNDKEWVISATSQNDQIWVQYGERIENAVVQAQKDRLIIHSNLGPTSIGRFNWQTMGDLSSKKGQLIAPMPATIVAILKNKGEQVKTGDRLIILEAMKMEHTIYAPEDGRLAEVFYKIGEQVNEGAELLTLKND